MSRTLNSSWAILVGLAGVEPATSPLSGVRSNQLSYRPELGSGAINNGGAKEDRTPDLLRARQALSQLSYSPRAFTALPN